ncbi:MAG: rubrerythrin family protein [Endomicrobium sp.]|jgi:rubrerythrin|nr:rubrerythrin family protein [Endomicrobium sp.]
MKLINGTKTEKNLLKSFICESQARLKYDFFASKAREEGFEQLASIFMKTSNNEKEHAKIFFSFLKGGLLEITSVFPSGVIGSTIENLKSSIDGESKESEEIYPKMAKIAEDENFSEIAKCFRGICVAEHYHKSRYLYFLKNIEDNNIFKNNTLIKWECRNCGYVYENKEALEKCPICLHRKSYMEKIDNNFYSNLE